VHLKIDTGMGRLGVPMHRVAEMARAVAGWPEVRVVGLMTHFACADAETDETQEQMARFDEAIAVLARHGIRPPVRHAANSAALFRGHARLDAVRPGIALFGVSPFAGIASDAGGRLASDSKPLSTELRQTIRVRTEIVDVREVEAGAAIGYGALWRAPRKSRIATVPMGYADGLARLLTRSNLTPPPGTAPHAAPGAGAPGGHILVRGKRAPIVGAVSMDMTMIDVTDLPGARTRDEAVVLGGQEGPLGSDFLGAEEIAAQTGTIAWEILTSISRRVPRFYREP
jgi:alanine racemase